MIRPITIEEIEKVIKELSLKRFQNQMASQLNFI